MKVGIPKESTKVAFPTVRLCIETSTQWGRGIIKGVIEYSRRNGPWHLLLEPHGPNDHYTKVSKSVCDGVIARVAGIEMAKKFHGVPMVNVSSIDFQKDSEFPRVVSSVSGIASLAIEHFRSKGISHFAYVGNTKQGPVQTQQTAFSAALSKIGFRCDVFSNSTTSDRLGPWLKMLKKPVGILCWGPSIGRQIIDTASDLGINVPHDIAVLGADFDDLLSEASFPAQSGIRLAYEQIGATAASILDSLMHGRLPKKNKIEIAPRCIIERLSTDTLAVPDPKMASVIRFIKNHYREPITVDTILHANPMSRRSLERKFRETLQISIVEYIRQLRLNTARELLAETDNPITLVAEKSGFSTYNYMNHVFRSMTGISPSEYRKQCGLKISVPSEIFR